MPTHVVEAFKQEVGVFHAKGTTDKIKFVSLREHGQCENVKEVALVDIAKLFP
jgi:hypothetical protein